MYYKKHIFFCTNKRENKECCENHHANEMLNYAKKKLMKLGITKESKIKISSSGCMGRCKNGPVLVVYPEGLWYTYNSQKDIDEIITSFIQKDKIK